MNVCDFDIVFSELNGDRAADYVSQASTFKRSSD